VPPRQHTFHGRAAAVLALKLDDGLTAWTNWPQLSELNFWVARDSRTHADNTTRTLQVILLGPWIVELGLPAT